jgi:hypothetical protein
MCNSCSRASADCSTVLCVSEEMFVEPLTHPLMILVAGPYRSGTNDDPALIAANLQAMYDVSLQVWQRGHLPVTGEALALPLVQLAGSTHIGDAPFTAIMHPLGRLLAQRCDAVLRIGGASQGADEMVTILKALGRPVYYRIEDIPHYSESHHQFERA